MLSLRPWKPLFPGGYAFPMESSILRVSVPHFEEIEEGRIAFKVSVQYAKLSWEVWRRFSDFVALHEHLLASDYAALPELPPKTLLPSVTDTRFLEKRKNKLFNYLQDLLRRPDTRFSQELLNFLCLTEQAAVQSKCLHPVMVGTTGSQRFAVSSLAKFELWLITRSPAQSSWHLMVGSAPIHQGPVVGLSGLEGSSPKFLSAAADGSIRLVDGTTAAVLLVYSLKTKTPQFVAESRLSPEDPILVVAADPLGVFVGHGSQVSVLQYNRGKAERGAVLQLRDNAEAVHQLLTHENPDFLLSGGDSGTIKLWQLPHGSVLTPWSVHPPTQQFEGSSGCSRPAESDMRFGAEEDEQEEQPEDAGRHGEWVVNAASRNRNPALLRRYSSGSDDDDQRQPTPGYSKLKNLAGATRYRLKTE
ncbi:hypothetical protein cyc_04793 [Cyclospora cayetanensis]|uniref:PX domain-containing protein n=1 Tax=Cyclospora cayetanensis TaxID=88456 RepID=A0A1D3D5P6_9EIME|nr:hypothetical protein cyc_04793 [Cyclospora cayetanensis]